MHIKKGCLSLIAQATSFFVSFFGTTRTIIKKPLQFRSMCTIIVMMIFRIMEFGRAKDDRR